MTTSALAFAIIAIVLVALVSFALGFVFGAMLISAGVNAERKRPDLRVVK